MMKIRKISISILSTVLTLSLLLSAFTGMSFSTAADTEVAWDYAYAVTPNTTETTNVNYFNADNLGDIVNDFRAYAWNVTKDYVVAEDSDLYPNYTTAVPMATDNWPRAISANSVRQNASVSSGYRNAGYLDLQIADPTKPVAMTHKAEVENFYLEMDVVVSSSWSTSKGIMIAPAGEFALVNSETVADKGVFISLLRGAAGIAGAIDPSTAATLSTVSTSTASGGAFNDQPTKYEDKKARGNLYTWTADSSLLSVMGGSINDLVTYCIEVKDGVISVWTKDDTSKVLSVQLSDDYVGGQISFVSTSQNYNAFAGMRLQALEATTEWDYAVTQNTTNTYNATNLGDIVNDFGVYAWNVVKDVSWTNASGVTATYPNYTSAVPLASGYPMAVSNSTVTQNATSSNDAGYLDLKNADPTLPVALTHKKKVNEFYLEMDIVVGNSWTVHTGIMIAPAGEFALVNSETITDKGIYIAIEQKCAAVGGTIDPSNVTKQGTADYSLTSGSAFNDQPTKFEDTKVAVGGLYTWTADTTVTTNCNVDLVTYCVRVTDGVLSVWTKENTSNVVSVALSDDYKGGHVSFVSTGTAHDALAGMRLRDLTAFDYAVTQNTTDASYTVDDFANIAEDFKVYNWNIAESDDSVAYYAPTLTSGFPKAVDATTVTVPSYNSTSNEPIRNFGYMDIAEVKSGTVSAMTHWKTLDADDEYLLEMDFVVRKSIWSAPKGLMIAPAGEFAVSNDGNAANEKGIYISFDAGSNLSVTGAIEADGACTNGTATPGTSWGQQPFVNASTVYSIGSWGATLDTYTGTVADDGNKAPYTVTAGIVTVCVEVRDGILTVWPKHKPTSAMSVVLSDAYKGGNVSYVANSAWDHAFVGMRLTEHEPMEEGTVAINNETGIITVKGVEGKELKAGSFLASNYSGTMQYVPTRVGFRVADQATLYQVLDANGAVVTDLKAEDMDLEFVETSYTAADNYVANIGNIGNSYNESLEGLRFVSRFTRTAKTDGEYVVLGGTEYKIKDYGMLLTSDAGLKTTVSDLTDKTAVENAMVLNGNNLYVQAVSIVEEQKFYDTCSAHVDMAVTLIHIDNVQGYGDPRLIDFYARPYVEVYLNDTETTVLYGNAFSCNYASFVGETPAA